MCPEALGPDGPEVGFSKLVQRPDRDGACGACALSLLTAPVPGCSVLWRLTPGCWVFPAFQAGWDLGTGT